MTKSSQLFIIIKISVLLMLTAISGFVFTSVAAQDTRTQYDGMPTLSPDGTMVAFISDRDGNRDVWVMGADGSNPVNLTPDLDGWAFLPEWSPDGQQILFLTLDNFPETSNSDLWLASLDNTQLKKLTSDLSAGNALWSPDGKWIVFVILDGRDSSSIWIMDSDGNKMRRLFSGDETYFPQWSTDGKSISFVSRAGKQSQLSIIDFETGKIRLLPVGEIWGHVWSPNSKSIIYQIPRPDNLFIFDLWLLQTDAGVIFKLTDQPIPLYGELVWSPDGEEILLGIPCNENVDLGIFNLQQKTLTKITSCHEGNNAFASWFPDSEHILLQSDRGGQVSIWVISVDGKEAVDLVAQNQ